MKSADLRTIYDASESVEPAIRAEFLQLIEQREEAEQRIAEDERRRKEAVPEVVNNFRHIKPGTLVVRSPLWKEQRGQPDNQQIGMITELKIFEDDLCMAVFWPEIHWEGEMFSSINHPNNAVLKSGEELPQITMNANQQRKTPA